MAEPSAATVAIKGADHKRARRRLWHLPTQAHELLLALSFTADILRREAARTLGQIHKGRCVLKGRDVDVLYSVVHDMVTRNPLSEAMHKRLDERHALAVRQLAALRDEAALQNAWAAALDDDSAPSALWAVLTHPLGPALEAGALYDTRLWIFTHARRSVEAGRDAQRSQADLAEARQRAEQLQARLLLQHRQAADAAARAQAEIVRLQGELARHSGSKADRSQPADDASSEGPPLRMQRRATTRVAAPADPSILQQTSLAHAAAQAPASRTGGSPAPASGPIPVRGRRVLCVGGIQHAVARYRGRIEKLGRCFEHHDGGVEDGVHTLEGRLGRADVVICQAACINHEAYQRVKRHCERTGTPCVYLDRPSLSRLDRALGQPRGTAS